jgi:hypothetical protein
VLPSSKDGVCNMADAKRAILNHTSACWFALTMSHGSKWRRAFSNVNFTWCQTSELYCNCATRISHLMSILLLSGKKEGSMSGFAHLMHYLCFLYFPPAYRRVLVLWYPASVWAFSAMLSCWTVMCGSAGCASWTSWWHGHVSCARRSLIFVVSYESSSTPIYIIFSLPTPQPELLTLGLIFVK